MKRRDATVVIGIVLVGVLTACGGSSADPTEAGATTGAGSGPTPLSVATSFYPLQFVVEQVGGDAVEVTNLTPPGAEPHDLELTPQDVATIADADQVIYLSGFQPAVDEAVAEAGDRAFDVSPYADLSLTYTPIEEGVEEAEEAGSTDPHFWLDPLRLAAVADEVATQLGALAPDQAAEFTANADALRSELETLDQEWTEASTECASTDLVTSHNAFGYLADRYGFTQVGITGLTPEDEPSPKQLAAVADFVTANGVTTIYFETLVSPAIAEAVAAETGAQTAVLDPIEGLSNESQGADYFEIMRANLDSVVEHQSCS